MFVPAMTVCVPATSSSAPSASQTFPASSRRSVQLTYATAATLPEAESLYTYGFLETEALKKEFSKPRHHKTITTNKNPGIQKILGILAKKQPATVLLTFKHSASVSSQLHLAFAFAPKPSLTITSKNPLENWQKELINTLIKKDSFWVRHPFGVASGVGALTMLGAITGIAFWSDTTGNNSLRNLKSITRKIFKRNFLGRKKEFFIKDITSQIHQPFRALLRAFHLGRSTCDIRSLEIPSAATVALIWIPNQGAVTALVESGKLMATDNNEQLRILMMPLNNIHSFVRELRKYSQYLQENNCHFMWINNTGSEPQEVIQSVFPITKTVATLGEVAMDIAKVCSNFFYKKYINDSTQELTLIPYARIDAHVNQITRFFIHPDYLVRYPTLDKTWVTLGNEMTATTEIVIMPTSALPSKWLLHEITDGETDQEPRNLQEDFLVPMKNASIKKSILCMVNDTTLPYSTSTASVRRACNHATKFIQHEGVFRFDDFFIPHEPTSSTCMHSLHYIASESLDALIDETNDTNNTMKIFSTNTPTTTLELTYQAAAAYVNRIVNASEIASGREFNMSNIHFETENLNSVPSPHQHEALTQAIAWTAPDHEPDDFKRFEADIVAALHVIDREADLNILKTSASQTLSSLVLETQGAASSMHRHSKYNILLAQDEHRGTITARSQLNSALANKHWQLVVFGKTIISTNNNRYFVNLEPGATPGAYKITTNINPEGIKCNGYKSAIIKIAQALQTNHLHMQSDAAEADRWAYTSPLPSTKSPLAISSPQAGAGSSIRRSSTPFTPPATQSDARAIFEILNLGPIAAWCTSLGETEAPTYNHVTIVCLELVTLQSKSTKRFMSNRTKEGRKYIFFCTAPQKEITEFMKGLKREQKDNIFIVSNYAKAKMLDDAITLTCASGTSDLSLTRLQMLLTA